MSVLPVTFDLEGALGPLVAGYLIGFGYVVPFVFGGAMATIGAVLVYAQVDETVTGDGTGARRTDDGDITPRG